MYMVIEEKKFEKILKANSLGSIDDSKRENDLRNVYSAFVTLCDKDAKKNFFLKDAIFKPKTGNPPRLMEFGDVFLFTETFFVWAKAQDSQSTERGKQYKYFLVSMDKMTYIELDGFSNDNKPLSVSFSTSDGNRETLTASSTYRRFLMQIVTEYFIKYL